jgi:hypothetical protein
MSQHPHEPDELEPDPTVPPRPEEAVADAARGEPADVRDRGRVDRPKDEPVAGGDAGGAPAQGEGRPDSH